MDKIFKVTMAMCVAEAMGLTTVYNSRLNILYRLIDDEWIGKEAVIAGTKVIWKEELESNL